MATVTLVVYFFIGMCSFLPKKEKALEFFISLQIIQISYNHLQSRVS